MSSLLAQLDIDTDSDGSDIDVASSLSGKPSDPLKPWAKDFRLYLDTVEVIPEGMDHVRWWGVSRFCL